MRCARWVVATSMMTGVGACSLTTSFDGFSGGAAPGPRDASLPDSTTNHGGIDAGMRVEAGVEAGATDYRTTVLADAPLAYFRLDDDATTAKDEVGAHDGIYMGPTKHTAGAITNDTNGAAVFDGASSYIDVGDALPFLNNGPFTIEAWVSPSSGATDPACIVSKSYASGGVGGNITDGYTFYLEQDSNALNVARYRSGADDTTSGPGVPNGAFSHVVATYDGAAFKIWLDGVSVGSGDSKKALLTTKQPLTIGASRGGIYCFFRGALDEVALYGAVLSDDRIRAHHKMGLGK